MKQIGNLAVVCAARPEISLQLYDHMVSVCVGQGPQRAFMRARWDDDEAIQNMIRELNFGAYSPKRMSGAADRESNTIHTKTGERE